MYLLIIYTFNISLYFQEIFISTNLPEVNESNTTEQFSIAGEEKISSALCFWYIATGINVRDHNIKTYFPQREISGICIMQDIKLMLINMGTTYFLVDSVSILFFKPNFVSYKSNLRWRPMYVKFGQTTPLRQSVFIFSFYF